MKGCEGWSVVRSAAKVGEKGANSVKAGEKVKMVRVQRLVRR